MAVSTQRILTGRRRRARRAMSDINMTPFIDIMLVLLIVFMVTAPLMTVGVPVDLPKTNASPIDVKKDPLYVSVRTDGSVYVQEKQVSVINGELESMLIAVTGNDPEARILVRGDQSIAYGKMLEVMGRINTAGFKKVGLVAELPSGAPTAAPKVGGGTGTPSKR